MNKRLFRIEDSKNRENWDFYVSKVQKLNTRQSSISEFTVCIAYSIDQKEYANLYARKLSHIHSQNKNVQQFFGETQFLKFEFL